MVISTSVIFWYRHPHIHVTHKCTTGEEETYLDGRCVDIKLAEDGKGLLVQLVADGNVGNVGSVVVVQACDVLHDARAVGLDGGQDEQVLEVAVLGEQRVVKNDLLQELDEFVGQVGGHEGLDGGRHLIRVLCLAQCGLDNLYIRRATRG